MVCILKPNVCASFINFTMLKIPHCVHTTTLPFLRFNTSSSFIKYRFAASLIFAALSNSSTTFKEPCNDLLEQNEQVFGDQGISKI